MTDDPIRSTFHGFEQIPLREDAEGTPVEYVETVYREAEILSFNL